MEHKGQSAHLFVLMGPSGAGKTTILRYIEQRCSAESAPKYTSRPTRGTEEDERDFIFCTPECFPVAGVLRFESYGHLFGIQLDRIDESLRQKKSHVTIVGDCDTMNRLSERYGDSIVPIFVFCNSTVLKARISSPDAQRSNRWPQVQQEISAIYDQLGCIEYTIDNSGELPETLRRLDRLLSKF